MGISNIKCKISNIPGKVRGFGYWSPVLIFAVCSLVFAGCASLKEGAKCFIGVSTKDIEASRKDAISESFDYTFNACYAKTEKILKDIGAYTYAKNKSMIAVYVSAEDTTPVGLYFKELTASSTQIEVSSPSSFARELIAGKVFSALRGISDEE